mgnify:CR=1 FL=1
MRYQLIECSKSGIDLLPCYEATVKNWPNLFEKFFGETEKCVKYFSDYGFYWYDTQKFEEVEENSILWKLLNSIVKRDRGSIARKIYDSLKTIKVDQIVEQSKIMN